MTEHELKTQLEASEKTIVGLRASMKLIANRLKKTTPIVDFLNANNAPQEVKNAWKELVYTSGIRAGMEAECDPREWYITRTELDKLREGAKRLWRIINIIGSENHNLECPRCRVCISVEEAQSTAHALGLTEK